MIRLATQNDADSICVLLAELGYPSSLVDVRRRMEQLETDHDWVFVSEREGAGIVGLIGVHAMRLLHTDGLIARITALVVKDDARGSGAGRELVMAARMFARQTGCTRMEVTSGDRRTDAHAFYEKLGFREDERRYVMDLGG